MVASHCIHHQYMEIQPLLQQLVNLAGHCSQEGTDQFSPISLTVFLNTSPRPPWPPPRRPSRRPPVVHESVEPGGNLGGTTWGKPPEPELSYRLKLLRFQSQLGRNLWLHSASLLYSTHHGSTWFYMVLHSTWFYSFAPRAVDLERSQAMRLCCSKICRRCI